MVNMVNMANMVNIVNICLLLAIHQSLQTEQARDSLLVCQLILDLYRNSEPDSQIFRLTKKEVGETQDILFYNMIPTFQLTRRWSVGLRTWRWPKGRRVCRNWQGWKDIFTIETLTKSTRLVVAFMSCGILSHVPHLHCFLSQEQVAQLCSKIAFTLQK